MWHRQQLAAVVQQNSYWPALLKMCFCPQHLSQAHRPNKKLYSSRTGPKSKIKSGTARSLNTPKRVTSHGHFLKLVKRQPVATCSSTTFWMWHRQQLVVVVQHNSNRPAPLKMCFCPQHLSVASSLLLGRGRTPAKYLPIPRWKKCKKREKRKNNQWSLVCLHAACFKEFLTCNKNV